MSRTPPKSADTAVESTPLLPSNAAADKAASYAAMTRRVFIMAFFLALSFSFTQTSLIYAFRLMTCEEYYKTHEWTGTGDRCELRLIEAETARNVAIMSTTTTSCCEFLRACSGL